DAGRAARRERSPQAARRRPRVPRPRRGGGRGRAGSGSLCGPRAHASRSLSHRGAAGGAPPHRSGGADGQCRGGHGMTVTPLVESRLPLTLVRRGKVREMYAVDAGSLLMVASDRVSAFDVVMREAVPHKGAVLTQMSAFWFARLKSVMPHHLLTADVDEIVRRVPVLTAHRDELHGRGMLTRRATPVPFECVV